MCVWDGRRALVTRWRRSKGRDNGSCTSIRCHTAGPPAHPQESQRQPPPKPAHYVSPGSTIARLFEGQVEKKTQTSLFQNRILACPGQVLVFSLLLLLFFLKKKQNKTKGRYIVFQPGTSLRPARPCWEGRGPSSIPWHHELVTWNLKAQVPYQPTTLPVNPPPHHSRTQFWHHRC